jgi:magnesium chelatase family protein
MDRIDLHVDVPAVTYQELAVLPAAGESSVIRQRVIRARQLQSERFRKDFIYCNAQMGNRHIRTHCVLSSESDAMLQTAAEKFSLSVRAIFRILKMARTIADLDREQDIGPAHLAEAIQYRIPSF